MKTLLGVLAATIWGSSRSRVRLHTDLQVPVSSGDVTDPPRQSTRFSCHGVSRDHDDCTDILHFPARVLVVEGQTESLTLARSEHILPAR